MPIGDGRSREEGRKIIYDTLVDKNKNYPATATDFITFSQRYAPKIIGYWQNGTLPPHKWMVFNHTLGETYENMDFASPSDYITWKNSRVHRTGSMFTEDVTLHPYDVLDSRIPQITRIWGYNSLFMAFVGAKRYKNHPITVYWGKPDNFLDKALVAIWDTAFPAYAGRIATSQLGNQMYMRRVFWVPRKYRSIYNSPKTNNSEIVTSNSWTTQTGARICYNSVSDVWNVPHDGVHMRIGKINYLVYDDSGNNYDFTGYSHHNIKAFRNVYFGNNASAVMFYPLNDPGDQYHAVLIKPLGVDVFWLDYYNENFFDLELIYLDYDKQIVNITKVDPSEIYGPHNDTEGTGLKKETIYKGINASFLNIRSSTRNIEEIYFRLRKKGTHLVGPLSRAKIITELGHPPYPVRTLVRPSTLGW